MIKSPVIKTVTSIARGVHRTSSSYVAIDVVNYDKTSVSILIGNEGWQSFDASDLREAAELFNALADVLEGDEYD